MIIPLLRIAGRAAAVGVVALSLTSALSLTLAPPAAAVEKGVFFPETFTLANGMQVVVVTNRRVPVVTHMVWYKVGSADEPRGVSGIAHFLEHLMFKGTETLEPGDFSRIVARNGGRDNAFTSYDYTAYYQNVARDRLELVMRMEADRMANLRLTDEVVYPERDVILEERRQRTDNEPQDRLREQVDAVQYVHHPYGTPVIGWASEMASLTRADAESFYRTWYSPSNAILVVSGDISAAELRPLAETYYGSIPARAVPPRIRVTEPPITAERRVTLRDPEVQQPTLTRSWIAPSYRTAAGNEAYALQVLAEIMSGGSDSRLYRSLVVERKIATSAWLGYGASAWDNTEVSAGAIPAPGHGIRDVEAALEEQVAALLQDGVTEAEVARAVKRLLAAAAYARDSLNGPAQALGSALATGQTIDDVENWPVRIAAVTKADVDSAARLVLGRSNHVTGVLLPAGSKES